MGWFGNAKQHRYASIFFGGNTRVYVSEHNGRFIAECGDKNWVLKKSENGTTAVAENTYHGYSTIWFPLSGWTNTELRQLGFTVEDDSIKPQEVQLAKAVLDGERAAALALADWVTENWTKEQK